MGNEFVETEAHGVCDENNRPSPMLMNMCEGVNASNAKCVNASKPASVKLPQGRDNYFSLESPIVTACRQKARQVTRWHYESPSGDTDRDDAVSRVMKSTLKRDAK